MRREIRSLVKFLEGANRQLSQHLTWGRLSPVVIAPIIFTLTLTWSIALSADWSLMNEYFSTLYSGQLFLPLLSGTISAGLLRASMMVALAITAGYMIEVAMDIAPSPVAIESKLARFTFSIAGVVMLLATLALTGAIAWQVYDALAPNVCASELGSVNASTFNYCVEQWRVNTLGRTINVGLAEVAALGTAFLFFAPIAALSTALLITMRLIEGFLRLLAGRDLTQE